MDIKSLSWTTLENGLTLGYDKEEAFRLPRYAEGKLARPFIPTSREIDLLTDYFGELDWRYDTNELNKPENLSKVVLAQERHHVFRTENGVITPLEYYCRLIYPMDPRIDSTWENWTYKDFTYSVRQQKAGILSGLILNAGKERLRVFLDRDRLRSLFEDELEHPDYSTFHPAPITVPISVSKILPYALLSSEQAKKAVDAIPLFEKAYAFGRNIDGWRDERPYSLLSRAERRNLRFMLHQVTSRDELKHSLEEAKKNWMAAKHLSQDVRGHSAEGWEWVVTDLRKSLGRY